jgi:hypothetical protein
LSGTLANHLEPKARRRSEIVLVVEQFAYERERIPKPCVHAALHASLPAKTAELTAEPKLVPAREVIHGPNLERTEVPTAVEPKPPQKRVERFEGGVGLGFNIEPIGG